MCVPDKQVATDFYKKLSAIMSSEVNRLGAAWTLRQFSNRNNQTVSRRLIREIVQEESAMHKHLFPIIVLLGLALFGRIPTRPRNPLSAAQTEQVKRQYSIPMAR